MFLQAAVFNAVAAEGDLSSGWERRHKSFALIRLGAAWLSHPTAQATYEDEPPLCRKTPVTNEILATGDRKKANDRQNSRWHDHHKRWHAEATIPRCRYQALLSGLVIRHEN